MSILTFLLLTVPLAYAIVVGRFIGALFSRPEKKIPVAAASFPGISIIVPFRNEAHNLARLCASLGSQTYHGDFEIVLVNDGSADNFQSVLAALDTHPNRAPVRVIDGQFSPARRLTSKQQALEYGIREAKYDWIALTDADMDLDPEWLETLITASRTGAKLVFGHTAIAGGANSFFTRFQAFQLETLFSFAYAFSRSGITGSCMGNNLLVSKTDFMAINGFASIGYSIVEDMDLLAAFRKKGIPVAATEPFRVSAHTLPSSSIGAHLQQLLRWGRGGFRPGSTLSYFGVLAALHTVLFIVSLCGLLPAPLFWFLIGNQVMTWMFITLAFKKIKSTENALLFPLFLLAALFELPALAVMILFGKQTLWKERAV